MKTVNIRVKIVGGLENVPKEQLDRQVDTDMLCKVMDVGVNEPLNQVGFEFVYACVSDELVKLKLNPLDYTRIPGVQIWAHKSLSEYERLCLREALPEEYRIALEDWLGDKNEVS